MSKDEKRIDFEKGVKTFDLEKQIMEIKEREWRLATHGQDGKLLPGALSLDEWLRGNGT